MWCHSHRIWRVFPRGASRSRVRFETSSRGSPSRGRRRPRPASTSRSSSATTPCRSSARREVLLDSEERPVALIETVDCRVVRLADVDDRHAIDEGEGYADAHEFRVAHERFWNGYIDELRASLGDPEFALDDDTLVVLQRFRIVTTRMTHNRAMEAGSRTKRPSASWPARTSSRGSTAKPGGCARQFTRCWRSEVLTTGPTQRRRVSTTWTPIHGRKRGARAASPVRSRGQRDHSSISRTTWLRSKSYPSLSSITSISPGSADGGGS